MLLNDAIPVCFDGQHFGRIFPIFHLRSLTCVMLGGDAFDEVYLETSSGNVYAIYQDRRGNWVLLNKREKARYEIADGELEKMVAEKGQPMYYGNGGNTSRITRIYCVQTQRVFVQSYLRSLQTQSTIRSEFLAAFGGSLP